MTLSTYRYSLERSNLADCGLTLLAIMLNPSTATDDVDDPTIRKLKGFCTRNGFQRFLVGNLFAFRATEPSALRNVHDPIGPDNDSYIQHMAADADEILVAWGSSTKFPPRFKDRHRNVISKLPLNKRIACLGTCSDGHPRHPLMVSYSQPMVTWTIDPTVIPCS